VIDAKNRVFQQYRRKPVIAERVDGGPNWAESRRLPPVLAAFGPKTTCIEIGTVAIDMRYENPIYMAEDASAVRTRRSGPPFNATSRQPG